MRIINYLTIFAITTLIACTSLSEENNETKNNTGGVEHPEWSRTASIYEVNIRQYSQEGTFKAFENDLERVKKLGVDILWLMPVHPIGEINRKGTLGSYYSVKSYVDVNPEFGTMEDFKSLVNKAHSMNFKIIIDWVPNHTAWDHAWIENHPGFYELDSTGNMFSPFDWTDVVQLDYDNKEMRDSMVNAMKFWLTEGDIDGFRCDVAHQVPKFFWDSARVELDKVKKIFMLAEADQPFLHEKAFDMTYAWPFHHIMNEIAKGHKNANDIEVHFNYIDSTYPPDSYLMHFTSNHDENSWAGTVFERMGESAETFAVLTCVIPGMPLVYNGQEAGMNKRLEFFEKDVIEWTDHPFFDMYKTLFELKETNNALYNGDMGGDMIRIESDNNEKIFAFIRESAGDKIIAVFNLTDESLTTELNTTGLEDSYTNVFSASQVELSESWSLELAPWGYLVLEKQKE